MSPWSHPSLPRLLVGCPRAPPHSPALARLATSVEESYDDDDLGGTGNAEDLDDGDLTFAEDHQSSSHADRRFDEVVGALEELLLEDEFTALQSAYLRRHCHEFDDTDENKLAYTSIFDGYVERMETFIDAYLTKRVPDFDMRAFLEECEVRGEEQLAGDAFDVLTSMSDFGEFKQLMLAEKQAAQWRPTENTAARSPTKKPADGTEADAAAATSQ